MIAMTSARGAEELAELYVDLPQCCPHDSRFAVTEVCGVFGRDLEGEYCDGTGIIKYLHIPPSPQVHFDLTLRHELDEERIDGYNHNHFLQWIMKNSKDSSGNPCPPRERFVIAKSMFTALLMTPYATNTEGWFMRAVKLRDTIYLDEESETAVVARYDILQEMLAKKLQSGRQGGTDDEDKAKSTSSFELTDEDMVQLENRTREACSYENMNMYCRYGGKFEQYLTSNSPSEAPDPKTPLRMYDDFSTSVRARLGNFTLLYAGEIDCIMFKEKQDLSDLTSAEFVELKTVKEGCNMKAHKRYRLLKFWSQCVLANCKWILLGHRDDTVGVVRRLERIRVDQIPHNVDRLWYPGVCFKFASSLLDHIDSVMAEQPKNTVIEFQFRPEIYGRRIKTFNKQEQAENFLPENYLTWLRSLPELYVPPAPARIIRGIDVTKNWRNHK